MQEIFMRQALALAREAAAAGEVPVGCVIVREGVIVGRGRNRREEKRSALSHAETEAIAQAITGCRYERGAVREALERAGIEGAVYRVTAGEMAEAIAD